MQIYLLPEKNGVKEWMAVEMHGTISHEGLNLNGELLGTLCWGEKNNAYIIIGNHLLEGKVSKLDRPFLVLEKGGQSANTSRTLAVNAVIRKKITFKTRPSPLLLK